MSLFFKAAAIGAAAFAAIGLTSASAHPGHGHSDNGYYSSSYGNGYRNGKVVYRETFPTRHQARIVLVERAYRTPHGRRLVCTVKARGPDRDYVSRKRMRRIANRTCSPRARISVYV